MSTQQFQLDNIIDLEKWQKLQDSLSLVTKMAIITTDYKGVPVSQHSQCQSFCKAVRQDETLSPYCQKCDARGGLDAVRLNKPYIYRCHFNIIDIAIPIIVHNQYVGAIMAGQVLLKDDSVELEQIVTRPSSKVTDEKFRSLEQDYTALPVLTYDEVTTISDMLYHLCNYMVEEAIDKNAVIESYRQALTANSSAMQTNAAVVQEHSAVLANASGLQGHSVVQANASELQGRSVVQANASGLQGHSVVPDPSADPLNPSRLPEQYEQTSNKSLMKQLVNEQLLNKPLFNEPSSSEDLVVECISPPDLGIKKTAASSILQPAFDYMYTHRSVTIKLTDMADLCHVSPSYFSRLFTKETGESFSTFVPRLKMECAKQMLESTDSAISQISNELGFSEPSYFIKTFKKFEKCTPAVYRKKAWENGM
ncbi:PocR ligand-binding domain-containing protein [Paenibacillus agilis]|uniref:Helix-turn-helix domain-containing protein n=1 Tax=Paenibacillus agilis TaxID=3020863 RepID=A0A559IGS3_9BACL|nr:PocR ligand-binding domain-containing protein [Paenibacillus agilis]TVX86841.1 helix-turn-helix domain-containing protein [Paenibacillus agilis]